MTKPVLESLTYLYKVISNQLDDKSAEALLLLELRSWLTKLCDFDPRSGHELPQGLDEVLNKLQYLDTVDESPCDTLQDRLFRIIEHIENSLKVILENPRDRILREHALVPIYAAREVDSVSVQWLSKQPGRNLREKLAGKPYIKAVRRRNCVDTAENRLLKSFLKKLENLLFSREEVFKALNNNCDDDLLPIIQRWFRNGESTDIGLWGNIPPNNILLQDKNYRKIWDGWLWLQRLDADIASDHKRLNQDLLTTVYWSIIATLKKSKQIRLIQQPVVFDYDSFELKAIQKPFEGYFYPLIDDKRFNGEVCTIKDDRGFGFIQTYNNPKLFFHASDMINIKFDKLKEGDSVSFIIEKSNNKGDCAKEVKLQQKPEKLLCRLKNNEIQITIGSEQFSFTGVDADLFLQLNKKGLNHLLKEIPSTVLKYFNITSQSSAIKHDPIKSNKAVIDLHSIRPTFTTDSTETKRFPFRLLIQKWQSQQDGSIDIDCATSNAIQLSSDIYSNSMYSLFADGESEEKYPEAFKKSSAMFFAGKISNYLKVENLTYLVPDAISEFSLESIRKSINFYYPNAIPLPRSIAAIFEWQSSSAFEASVIKKGDIVTIIDINRKGYSFTPIICKWDEKLESRLPQSKGFYWERHPTVIKDKNNVTHELFKRLKSESRSKADTIIELFGLDGLTNEAEKLSFIDNDVNWYDLPGNLNEFTTQNALEYKDVIPDIRKTVPSVQKLSEQNSLFLLPLSKGIKKPDHLGKSTHWLNIVSDQLTNGGLILSGWQKNIDIPLWRDHLPTLSIQVVRDGAFEKFYLVKDTTVSPMRGQQVVIPVKETFTLPANQSSYSFPLVIGEGNQSSHNVAELKSPAFPLKENTECNLHMTYTYGADDPYDLKFISLDEKKSGFKSVNVKWCSVVERPIDLSSLPVPSFPPSKSWADFQKYPKENGKGYSDLLDWVKGDMEKIVEISSFLKREESNRNYDGAVKQLRKSLRFPVFTIWNNGNSLSEADVPEKFREAITKGTDEAVSIIESKEAPEPLKEELFFFLSCLHRDTPSSISEKLIEYSQSKEELKKYFRNIAFAIGTAELEWQQKLLSKLIGLIDNKCSFTLVILAIVFWRVEDLIYQLTEPEINNLRNDLLGCIKYDLTRITNDGRGEQVVILCKHLELLLALLRTRSFESESIKAMLAPDKAITRSFIELVEEIINRNVVIESRISLEIEKPEMFYSTPDLLYALNLYLTGDLGANAIVIKGVSDD